MSANERVFRWGLSQGVAALAIAGLFWYGVSFAIVTPDWEWPVWALSTTFQVAITTTLLWAALRLRRKSGFTTGDLRRGDEGQRRANRKILWVFASVVVIQAVLVSAAVWWCVHTGATDMIWPAIGLVVSAHFAPLARLFHVRVYHATALAGMLLSLSALTGFVNIHRIPWFGPGMAAVMWLSAWYIVRNADRITAGASPLR